MTLARKVTGLTDPGVTLALGLGGDNGPFPDVTKLELQATSLQKPLGAGIFFQRLGGGFTRCTLTGGGSGAKLSANAGLSFGPRLKIDKIWEGELLSADGALMLDLCKDLVELSGTAKIVEVPVSQVRVRHQFGELTDFNATARFSLGQVAATVTGSGWATMSAANFEGVGQLRMMGSEHRGDVIISSKGLAGCYSALGSQIGFRKFWGQSLEKVTGACSVGPVKVAKPAGAASASAAGTTIQVPAGLPLYVFVARGAKSPPAISVRGPGGRAYEAPAGPAPIEFQDFIVLRDPETATTYVIVHSPQAGTWRMLPRPEQSEDFQVASAEGLPQPRVKAKVAAASGRGRKGRAGTKGRASGAKRILTWRLRRLPGQQVTFIERGAGVARVIARTRAASGSRRFTPAPGPGGRRRIEVLVEQGGMPRARLTVAAYKAPATRRTRAVRGLTRSLPAGKKARGRGKRRAKARAGRILRWQPQAAASEYSLVVRRPDGRTIVATPRAARLRLPKATTRERLQVTILALDRLGRPGPVRTFTLR